MRKELEPIVTKLKDVISDLSCAFEDGVLAEDDTTALSEQIDEVIDALKDIQ